MTGGDDHTIPRVGETDEIEWLRTATIIVSLIILYLSLFVVFVVLLRFFVSL